LGQTAEEKEYDENSFHLFFLLNKRHIYLLMIGTPSGVSPSAEIVSARL
jgi:hypothetical protein